MSALLNWFMGRLGRATWTVHFSCVNLKGIWGKTPSVKRLLGYLHFESFFWILISYLLHKKRIQKKSIPKNVRPFLFCQGFMFLLPHYIIYIIRYWNYFWFYPRKFWIIKLKNNVTKNSVSSWILDVYRLRYACKHNFHWIKWRLPLITHKPRTSNLCSFVRQNCNEFFWPSTIIQQITK